MILVSQYDEVPVKSQTGFESVHWRNGSIYLKGLQIKMGKNCILLLLGLGKRACLSINQGTWPSLETNRHKDETLDI